MSGHNKWSKIKHKKAATDAQKSRVFGKIARLLAVESKRVQGDMASASLRTIIEKAKQANMPTDNITRAVQKGKNDTGMTLEEMTYEAYGPGGIAIIIVGLTDNRNRTAGEIKHILSKNGIALASQGAGLWAFEKKDGGYIPKTTVEITEDDGEKLEALREELLDQDDVQDVYTNEI